MSTVSGNMLRAHVRAALEEATGQGLSVDDPTADELLVTAAQLGREPAELIEWISAVPKPRGWSPAEFARWVKAGEVVRNVEMPTHCYSCGAYLMGMATEHRPGCEIARLIEETFGHGTDNGRDDR